MIEFLRRIDVVLGDFWFSFSFSLSDEEMDVWSFGGVFFSFGGRFSLKMFLGRLKRYEMVFGDVGFSWGFGCC